MNTIDSVKVRASKLREELDAMGHELSHSESLEVVSKVEGFPDWNTHTANLSKQRELADQYLDELLEAEKEVSHAKFTRRFEQQYIINFTERNFQRQMRNMQEEFGAYVKRMYLGCLKGEAESELRDRHPGLVRHIWRGIFERAELFLIVGIYHKDGTHYIANANFRGR